MSGDLMVCGRCRALVYEDAPHACYPGEAYSRVPDYVAEAMRNRRAAWEQDLRGMQNTHGLPDLIAAQQSGWAQTRPPEPVYASILRPHKPTVTCSCDRCVQKGRELDERLNAYRVDRQAQ